MGKLTYGHKLAGQQLSHEEHNALYDAVNALYDQLIQVANPLALTTSKVDVTAYGGTNGSITATGQNGSGSYQYRINSGAWSSATAGPYTFSNLTAGTKTVEVRDANDTTKTASTTVTLTQPAVVQSTATITSVSPSTATTGTPQNVAIGYSYNKNNEQITELIVQKFSEGDADWSAVGTVIDVSTASGSGTRTHTGATASTFYRLRMTMQGGEVRFIAVGTWKITFTAPQPITFYGWKADNTILTESQIEASAYSVQHAEDADYILNFNQNSTPLYHWVAELISQDVKTKWQDTINTPNNGLIGGEEDLFGPTQQVIGTKTYRFYITQYATNFANPVQFKKI